MNELHPKPYIAHAGPRKSSAKPKPAPDGAWLVVKGLKGFDKVSYGWLSKLWSLLGSVL